MNSQLSKRGRLVLLRHGESQWNQENRFTGWVDVDLSAKGVAEAEAAGKLLKEMAYHFDWTFTSLLKRAIRTHWMTLEQMDQLWQPVTRSWRLNERHYGGLQGLNKSETAAKHGEAQVKIWRRSYDTPPPLISIEDPQHPSHDQRYASVAVDLLPRGESLKDTVARVLPFWDAELRSRLQAGESLLVVAHGNSIRALVQYLEKLSPAEIMEVNIPTGVPLEYRFAASSSSSSSSGNPLEIESKTYLGDSAAIAKAMDSVAHQGQAQKK